MVGKQVILGKGRIETDFLTEPVMDTILEETREPLDSDTVGSVHSLDLGLSQSLVLRSTFLRVGVGHVYELAFRSFI